MSLGKWYAGKNILVTGGTSGIGLCLVERLAAMGGRVYFCGRDASSAADISARSGAEGYITDLSLPSGRQGLLAWIKARAEVDILVNNAGLGDMADFSTADPARLSVMLETNVMAVVDLTRALAAQIARRPGGGILNVGSVASFFPTSGSAVYGASKHFILGLTDALHAELKGRGVHVCGVYPGKTYSRFKGRASGTQEDWVQAMPAGRVADIALAGLKDNRVRVVPGIYNRLMVLAARILPVDCVLGLTAGRSSKS